MWDGDASDALDTWQLWGRELNLLPLGNRAREATLLNSTDHRGYGQERGLTHDRYDHVTHLGGRPSALHESITLYTFLKIATFSQGHTAVLDDLLTTK